MGPPPFLESRLEFYKTCRCPILPYYVGPVDYFAFCRYEVTDLKDFNVRQIELKPERQDRPRSTSYWQ